MLSLVLRRSTTRTQFVSFSKSEHFSKIETVKNQEKNQIKVFETKNTGSLPLGNRAIDTIL